MSREKQIEEMAHDMCGNGMSNGNCAIDDEPCHLECVYGCCAERLYAKGYRKQSEGEWKSGKTPNGQWGYYCSICTASFVGENAEWIAKEHNYCPKCGAKMKGGAE